MANRTVKDAHTIKGTNPQYLIEKIIRTRIYESKYWKENCFALTAELLVDKAMQLKFIGGVYGGNVKPTPFLCLVLKMLQIQPEKDIIVEFIKNNYFKYVRALGAVYMRLTGSSLDCYKYLEPLYNDYRKLKRMDRDANTTLIHMDEFIDELLREERICDVILPRLQKRTALEENNQLEPRVSALEEDLDEMAESDEDEDIPMNIGHSPSPEQRRGSYKDLDIPTRSPSPRFRRSRSRSPHKSRDQHRTERSSGKRRSRSRERDRGREKRHRSPGHKSRDDDERRHKSSKSHRHRDDDHHREHRHRSSRGEGGKSSREDPEVREANELRARLGMAPLR